MTIGIASGRNAQFARILPAFLLGVIAWIPAIVSWFASEDIGQFYSIRGNPFGMFSWGEGIGFFRPGVSVALWLQESLWGINPKPYHLVNVLLHLGNSCLVYRIAKEWLCLLPESHPVRSQPVPFIAALWFWIWPSHAEPVSWILGITDVLASLPGLLSVWVYLIGRRQNDKRLIILAMALYFAGLLCKECVFMLPGVILMSEIARYLLGNNRKPDATGALSVVGFGLVALLYLALRRVATGAFIGGYGAVHTDFSVANLIDKLAPNLSHIFLPMPFTMHKTKYIVFGICLLLAAIWVGVQIARKSTSIRASLICFLSMAIAAIVAFLPGINLSTGAFMEGQRFAYFPSAFGIIASAAFAAMLIKHTKMLWTFAWIAALIFTGFLLRFNEFRYEAGKVARSIARGMKKLPQSRRLYVLTSPGTYRDAFIMPFGLQQIGKYMYPGFGPEEVPHVSYIAQWTPETQVQVLAEGPGVYRVRLNYPETKRNQPFILPMGGPGAASYFESRIDKRELIVTLKNFDPTRDRVSYVNGSKWVVLD